MTVSKIPWLQLSGLTYNNNALNKNNKGGKAEKKFLHCLTLPSSKYIHSVTIFLIKVYLLVKSNDSARVHENEYTTVRKQNRVMNAVAARTSEVIIKGY